MKGSWLIGLAGILIPWSAQAADLWNATAPMGHIVFTGRQAGSGFTGEFAKFSANIKFSPHDLAHSDIDVSIDVRSVNTQDEDRDDAIRGPELLWAQHYPEARYVSQAIVALPDGKFKCAGTLTLRNVTQSVPLEFTFKSTGTTASMEGTAQLKRLDFGVGKGDYSSTDAVADEVSVHFTLSLQAGPVSKAVN
jgi:polyisoprenoid-binding protein YceI